METWTDVLLELPYPSWDNMWQNYHKDRNTFING